MWKVTTERNHCNALYISKVYVTRQCDGGSVDRRWIEVICLSTARSATASKMIEIFVESEKNKGMVIVEESENRQ